jgi:hypothetical protein
MCDLNGNKVCDLGEIKSFSIITPELSVNIEPEVSMTISDVTISDEVLNLLSGMHNKQYKPHYNLFIEANRTEYIQTKRNKNNRIDKKWLKRYGYKEVLVPFEMFLKDCALTQNQDGNISSFSIDGKITL